MTAAEMPMTAGAAEEVLPLAGEEGALSAFSVLSASLSETSVPGTSEAGASAGISAGAETSGETVTPEEGEALAEAEGLGVAVAFGAGVGVAVGFAVGVGVGVGVGVKQPERHIHALDLGDAVLAAEQVRQQALALHMVAQGGLGRLFVELERDNDIRLQCSRELFHHNNSVTDKVSYTIDAREFTLAESHEFVSYLKQSHESFVKIHING